MIQLTVWLKEGVEVWKVEKRMLVKKYNKIDQLPYCEKYLSVNSE